MQEIVESDVKNLQNFYKCDIMFSRGDKMLERKLTQELNKWKSEKNRPCLIVKGARQVGKTFIVNEFAKNNYDNYIYINFELNPEYKAIFSELSFEMIIRKLEVTFFNVKLEENKTIIFLDEIQNCPNAITALKSFALDKRFDVIASGSLLGLKLKEISSYPVGYVREVELFPLDFEEFLWAVGYKKDSIEYFRNAFDKKIFIDEFMISNMSKQFELYIMIGGMPGIINEYLATNSLSKVLQAQRALIQNYKIDAIKYAEIMDKQKIINTLESIPGQLAKKNKKFSYNDINVEDKYGSARKYTSSLLWLKDAGIINYCYNLSEPALPLATNIKLNFFKVYMKDTGLLISMLEDGTQSALMNDGLYINKGGILENIFAQELASRYDRLMYFEKAGKLEIDFILNLNGVVTAIEAKSGNNKQSKSLYSILDNYKTVRRCIKFEKDCNVYIDDKGIEHYPLFMIMFI